MSQILKIAPLFLLGIGLGCAGQTGGAGATGPTSTQQRIVNINPIDLGVCFPKAPAIGDKLNDEILTGVLIAARPVVMECLVDPKNRGPADETKLGIKTTLTSGKLSHVLEGANTTPAGEACIRTGLDKFAASIPDWEKKAQASGTAKAEVQYQHVASVMPSVKMGVSEGSDVAGTIRLAQPTYCDCYGAWKDAPPAVLKASIKLTEKGAPAITIDPSTEAGAAEVTACLQPKLAALPLKTTSLELTTPYKFMFLNSSHDGMFPGAAPELSFAQYELARNQRLATAVIALGSRSIAAAAYDNLVQTYKKKPESVTAAQLIEGCNALVKTDDDYIGTLEKQLTLEQDALKMLTEFTAKDATWAPVKDGTTQNVDATKKELENGKGYKKADQDACPKVKL